MAVVFFDYVTRRAGCFSRLVVSSRSCLRPLAVRRSRERRQNGHNRLLARAAPNDIASEARPSESAHGPAAPARGGLDLTRGLVGRVGKLRSDWQSLEPAVSPVRVGSTADAARKEPAAKNRRQDRRRYSGADENVAGARALAGPEDLELVRASAKEVHGEKLQAAVENRRAIRLAIGPQLAKLPHKAARAIFNGADGASTQL